MEPVWAVAIETDRPAHRLALRLLAVSRRAIPLPGRWVGDRYLSLATALYLLAEHLLGQCSAGSCCYVPGKPRMGGRR